MKQASKAPKRLLSVDQAKALLVFAEIAGHQWRSKLRRLWAGDGGGWQGMTVDDVAYLRQVRNTITSANHFAKITLDHARLVILESKEPAVSPEPDFIISTWSPGNRGGFDTKPIVGVRIDCKVTGVLVASHRDRERSVYRNRQVCLKALQAAREASEFYEVKANAD